MFAEGRPGFHSNVLTRDVYYMHIPLVKLVNAGAGGLAVFAAFEVGLQALSRMAVD